MVKPQDLISVFHTMLREHWAYKWGSHEKGCVDCAGAFKYAFSLFGVSFASGSNTIARRYIVGELLPVSQAAPGMAAFKVRPWTKSQEGNSWYNKPPGDIYHIGLVDDNPAYVLNAKSEKSGFSRDKLSSNWAYVAYLKNVDYGAKQKMETMKVTLPAGVKGSTVNFRKQPSMQADIIEQIPVGSAVEVVDASGEWKKIQYQGRDGWMLGIYLSSENNVTVPIADLEKIYDTIGDWLGRRG